MKGQIWKRLSEPSRLRKLDLLLLILPTLIWALAVFARPNIMHLRCSEHPETCTRENVIWPDQLSVGLESAQADRLSFVTQDTSGAFAIVLPFLWAISRFAARRKEVALNSKGLVTDWILTVQSIVWNGCINELVRLAVQRPRPFVYINAARYGLSPAHYTSFYSGHTSFSAAAGTALVWNMIGHKAPPWLISAVVLVAAGLTIATGTFRVLSGRHFISDVIVGALAGITISTFVAYSHRKQNNGL